MAKQASMIIISFPATTIEFGPCSVCIVRLQVPGEIVRLGEFLSATIARLALRSIVLPSMFLHMSI